MKIRSSNAVWLTIAGAASLLSLPSTLTQAAPHLYLAQDQAPAHEPQNRYQGRVSNATSTGFMLTTRYGNQTISVTTGSSTKYLTTKTTTMSAVTTGMPVAVMGRVDDGANIVNAFAISILDKLPKARPNGGGERRRGVMGMVATTSPNLTITTDGGKTYTVTTTNQTRVFQTVPGSASDVANDVYVNVVAESAAATSGTLTMIAAKSITVVPPPMGHGGAGGGRRRGGADRGNATAAPAI